LFDDSIVHSSTILDSSADNDSTLYSQTARTSKPVRLVGRLRITHGSDVWDAAPTELSIWHPGMKKTGDIVQEVYNQDGEYATTSVAMPNDDTIPQNTEGGEFMTQAITPTSSINILKIEVNASLTNVGGTTSISGLFQDSTADAIAAAAHDIADGNGVEMNQLTHRMISGTTSSTTFKFRAGAPTAIATYFNGHTAARKMGGVMASSMSITEIQA
jgi:hypothetical protein